MNSVLHGLGNFAVQHYPFLAEVSWEDWTMRIAATCRCGKKFQAREDLAGQRLKCPTCGSELVVPTLHQLAAQAAFAEHQKQKKARGHAPKWLGVALAAVACPLVLASIVFQLKRPSPEQDLQKVHPSEQAAVRAVYDGISGFLTDDLGHVVAVKYAPFDFSGFVFTDVEAKHLSNLTELQALTLPMMGNQVTDEGVKALSSLSKLEYLAMSGTEKVTSSGFSHLGSLQNLKGLGLGMSPINDDGLSNLAGLSQLEFLDLTGAKIGDRGIGHLRGLKSLQSLALVSTAITDQSMVTVATLPKLQKLDIRGCNITDQGMAALAKCRNLRRLVAFPTSNGGGAITDTGLARLKTIKTLEYVNVAGTRVTTAGASALRRALPKCEVELTNTQEVDE